MIERIVLDANPLSLLCHPSPHAVDVPEINQWLDDLLSADATVYVPAIADYEVRRELLRVGRQRSIHLLDNLIETLVYIPNTTSHMRRAAELWAAARNQGILTASKDALDADVLPAAQAEELDAVVVTSNTAHLARFVQASHWRDLQP